MKNFITSIKIDLDSEKKARWYANLAGVEIEDVPLETRLDVDYFVEENRYYMQKNPQTDIGIDHVENLALGRIRESQLPSWILEELQAELHNRLGV